MSEKIIVLSLGGQDRTLDVGKWWFTKYYGEFTKADPINGNTVSVSVEREFDFSVAAVYAGMKTNYKVTGKLAEFNFTKEQIEDWVGEKEKSEISKFLTDLIKLMTDKPAESPGETEAQAAGA